MITTSYFSSHFLFGVVYLLFKKSTKNIFVKTNAYVFLQESNGKKIAGSPGLTPRLTALVNVRCTCIYNNGGGCSAFSNISPRRIFSIVYRTTIVTDRTTRGLRTSNRFVTGSRAAVVTRRVFVPPRTWFRCFWGFGYTLLTSDQVWRRTMEFRRPVVLDCCRGRVAFIRFFCTTTTILFFCFVFLLFFTLYGRANYKTRVKRADADSRYRR